MLVSSLIISTSYLSSFVMTLLKSVKEDGGNEKRNAHQKKSIRKKTDA